MAGARPFSKAMLKHIVPRIPEHTVYTEAFAGGAAVFFAKQPAEVEVLNDINGELMNFYQVAKTRFPELKQLIDNTLNSRDLHMYARFIYSYPWHFDPVRRAWAIWVLTKMSFASKIDGTYGYDKTRNHQGKKITNAIENFNQEICNRLQSACIENTTAPHVIKSRDTEKTFHFVDPPYIDTDCGHYKGYTHQNFTNLLELLEAAKGKFMLTMYPHQILDSFIDNNHWAVEEIPKTISVSKYSRRKQTELMVMNYSQT